MAIQQPARYRRIEARCEDDTQNETANSDSLTNEPPKRAGKGKHDSDNNHCNIKPIHVFLPLQPDASTRHSPNCIYDSPGRNVWATDIVLSMKSNGIGPK